MPSLGLTQLREVLRKRFGSELSVEILYLNHDFTEYLGLEPYWLVSEDVEVYHTGFGDWFFRQVAFPELEDNSNEYFERYYPRATETRDTLRRLTAEKRPALEEYFEELIRRYGLDQADVVGLTTMFHQTAACMAMARKVKQANPNILNMLGGANCRMPMGRVLAETSKHIDYVFTSVALRALPEVVAALLEGTPVNVPHVLPAGTNYCAGASERSTATSVIPARTLARSKRSYQSSADLPAASTSDAALEAEPPIDLDYGEFLASFRTKVASPRIKPTLLVETSRGCWWGQIHHCTFCGIDDAEMQFREMQPDRALAQFQLLFGRYPDVERIMAIDYILSRNHLKTVVPILNTPPHVCIYYDMKANMKPSDVDALSRAGIKVIQPGIESIATSTLNAMRKGVDAFQNVQLLIYCSLYDVFPDWNMLLGVPGQSDDAYAKYLADIPLLAHLPPPTGAHPVRFDRYSPYFSTPEEWGLKLAPFDFYALTYPFTDAQLSEFAYHHVNTNATAPHFPGLCKWFTRVAESVRNWQVRWRGADGKPSARLYLTQGPSGPVVFDSRSGEIKERSLGSIGARALELLSVPTRIEKLQNLGFGVEKEIDGFREEGWLFEEDDRFLSLVLPRQPPEPTFPNGFFAMEDHEL